LLRAPSPTDASVADASVAAAPRRAGAVDNSSSDRLTNASKVISEIREDITNNLPFTSSASQGCTADTSSFYNDVWGQKFDDRLQAVRALTLAFAFFGVLKLLSLLFCCGGGCCGGDGNRYYNGDGNSSSGGKGRGTLGWLTTLQVMAGWAGWLVFLWILLDIRGNQSAHDKAKEAGIPIDTAAAGRVESYWGHSFWLFLASTLVTTIGAMFGCC
jgi:hypothetical protein